MTLQRNMGHIDTLLDELGVGSLKNKSLRRLWILREFLRQQLEWFETGQSPPSKDRQPGSTPHPTDFSRQGQRKL